MALIDMVDKISIATGSKRFAVGRFIDLSKAFDTIKHSILLEKLQHYGIRGIPIGWFKSYMNNRMQYVEYKGVYSSLKNITCGVPQGSILGPLLFLIYINDIGNASKLFKFISFADDTIVFLPDIDITNLVTTMNIELMSLSDWL
jgi:hypothetical protein